MVPRSILAHRLRHPQLPLSSLVLRAGLATPPSTPLKPLTGPLKPYEHKKPPPPPQSWLTRKLKENPAALRAFLGFSTLLGYGSAKQVAGRRAYFLYDRLCAVKAEEEKDFWQSECHLPPTFQSWFSVTNLHVWLLTVRLRSLPQPHGQHHIQALIDHFFIDVEDRVRLVLQPGKPIKKATATTDADTETSSPSFYTVTNNDPSHARPKGNAPERIVTRQMKILKEQLSGLALSMDYALIKGDAEMAGAVWRNFLGGRGARGIVYPSSLPPEQAQKYYRRSINYSGSEVEGKKMDEKTLELEETRDDGSGIHDYSPNEASKYVKYPELMEDVVSYIRRELLRLEKLSVAEVTGPTTMGREGEGLEKLRFGKIREGRPPSS
ncbi:hypothetical protein C8Q75DRAFT_716400 [Abortiporus biennis]|nr:hypothetical protein C8Q75DRAFT_716400 [Abortiporus biennis]